MLTEELEAQNAVNELNKLKQNKFTLSRPIFFVPGWTDEGCGWWKNSATAKYTMEGVINDTATNPLNATFVTFEDVTSQCKSFMDFGEFLKKIIRDKIGKSQPFDIVGHSMGGLDIRAAMTQGDPLLNCRCCISVATPQQGDHFGGMMDFCVKYIPGVADLKKMPSYQVEQMKNLDSDYPLINILNTLENRQLFFKNIAKFYEMKGTRDFVVKGSAFMDKTGIEALYQDKTEEIPVTGCEHTGTLGITQDPRTILAIIYIISGIELDLGVWNCGIFAGGIERPQNDNNRFIGY